jgi:hypothetical protein
MKRYKSAKKHGKPIKPPLEAGFKRGRILFVLLRLEKLKDHCLSMADAEAGDESAVWGLYAGAIGTAIDFIEECLKGS